MQQLLLQSPQVGTDRAVLDHCSEPDVSPQRRQKPNYCFNQPIWKIFLEQQDGHLSLSSSPHPGVSPLSWFQLDAAVAAALPIVPVMNKQPVLTR